MTELAEAQRKTRKAIAKQNVALKTLRVEEVPIDSINPNAWNPNRQSDHDFELLKRSMTENGFTQPVIVLRESRTIVDGEHRWRAARDLGYELIPVVFVDMTLSQAKIATLSHNRARGSEDLEMAAAILRDLEALGQLDWAADSLMLEQVEIERLLNDVAAPEALAAESFSDAWIPQGTRYASEEGDGKVREIGGAPALEGISAAAADARRETEKQLTAAKSEEERQTVLREQDLHRVAFTYSGEEAKIVKQALGPNPAQKLLDLCRKELGLT
jgi:ParB/RepB/Spo0J family partition protein